MGLAVVLVGLDRPLAVVLVGGGKVKPVTVCVLTMAGGKGSDDGAADGGQPSTPGLFGRRVLRKRTVLGAGFDTIDDRTTKGAYSVRPTREGEDMLMETVSPSSRYGGPSLVNDEGCFPVWGAFRVGSGDVDCESGEAQMSEASREEIGEHFEKWDEIYNYLGPMVLEREKYVRMIGREYVLYPDKLEPVGDAVHVMKVHVQDLRHFNGSRAGVQVAFNFKFDAEGSDWHSLDPRRYDGVIADDRLMLGQWWSPRSSSTGRGARSAWACRCPRVGLQKPRRRGESPVGQTGLTSDSEASESPVEQEREEGR